MRTEKILLSSTILCALFLLTAPMFGGRAVWANRAGGLIRDAAGWDWAVPSIAMLAIAGLVLGVLTRPRVISSVLGGMGAAVAFAVAAYAAGSHWSAIHRNRAQPVGFDFERDEPYRVLAVPNPKPYAVVTIVAAEFSLVLPIGW